MVPFNIVELSVFYFLMSSRRNYANEIFDANGNVIILCEIFAIKLKCLRQVVRLECEGIRGIYCTPIVVALIFLS